MNRTEYIGRLTSDGEIIYSTTGTAFYRNTIAVDRKFKKDGEPDADFFKFKMFGKAAETFQQWTQKGSKVFLAGRNQTETYTDKDGNKRTDIKLIVDEFEFLDSKAKEMSDNDGFANIAENVELPFN